MMALTPSPFVTRAKTFPALKIGLIPTPPLILLLALFFHIEFIAT